MILIFFWCNKSSTFIKKSNHWQNCFMFLNFPPNLQIWPLSSSLSFPKWDTKSGHQFFCFFFLVVSSLFLFSFSLFFFLVSFSLPLSFKVENHIYDIAMQELNNMVDENDFEKFKRRIEDYGLPIEIIGKLVS